MQGSHQIFYTDIMDVFIFEMVHFECYISNMMETFIQPLSRNKSSNFLRIWLRWNNGAIILIFNLWWKPKNPLSLLEFPVLLLLAVSQSTERQDLFSLCLFSESHITNKLNSSIKSHPICDNNDTCHHWLKEKSHWPQKKRHFFPKGNIFSS